LFRERKQFFFEKKNQKTFAPGGALMFSDYMMNAWIAGTLIAIAAGTTGLLVVIRGETFAAHALPLGTFPGAAGAALLNTNPLYGLLLFAALGVLGLNQLGRSTRHDVATALTLTALLALGALFLSLSGGYANAVYAFLFGNILGISSASLPLVAALSLAAAAGTLLSLRPLTLSALSPALSHTAGSSPAWLEALFLVLLAIATVTALPVTGALLVFSLLTGPAAAARRFTARPYAALAISTALALVIIWAGIAASYLTNLPIGFFVGTFSALTYGAGRLAR
jgi:zinc/manganese transport system permease protein